MARPRDPSAAPIRRLGLAAVAFLLLTSGCYLFDSVGKDTATIEITSEPATLVRTITSNNFTWSFDDEGQQQFHLFQIDSGWVEVPHTDDFDLRETGLFYVQTAATEDPEAEVTLRVYVDGDLTYNHTGVIDPNTAGFRFHFVAY